MDHGDPTPASPSAELLQSLRQNLRPHAGARDRIRAKMQSKMMVAPQLLRAARETIRPDAAVSERIWEKIAGAASLVRLPVWDRLREALTPDVRVQQHLWYRLVGRLHPTFALWATVGRPAYARVLISRPLKIVAAFAILLFVFQLSPLLLTSRTVAESTVSVLPMSGEVSILMGGLRHPINGERILRKSAEIQTQDGEGTIVRYDDIIFRMGPHTTVTVGDDFADRPSAPTGSRAIFVQSGTLWGLGLVPRQVPGITIATPHGQVVVHEGSLSLTVTKNGTDVRVWHRGATVLRRGHRYSLVAGEQIALSATSTPAITSIDPAGYNDPWVSRNMAMDGAHQREIAEYQQERRAASAGVLPGSGLYRVKRFTENLDVLFTFDPEEKAKKLVTQANTRFSEAAALVARGSGSDAATPLREYRETLLAVASGSVKTPAVESLIEREVAMASADVSAALPGDPSYVLKQAARDTRQALLPDGAETQDAQAEELLDKLMAVKHSADEGEMQAAKVELEQIKSDLPLAASDVPLSPGVRKEVEATLSTVVAAVEPDSSLASDDLSRATQRTLQRIATRGQVSSTAPAEPLTDGEIAVMVLQIRNRVVGRYDTDDGQDNQLDLELDRLQKQLDPEEARILQALYRTRLPNGLNAKVGDRLREVAGRL